MKPQLLFLAILLATALSVSAQIGINNDGSAPNPSAILDVKSINKGLLIPRMTNAQRGAITSPADGLIIFCTDCFSTGALQVFHNGHWRSLKFSYPVAINVSQSGVEALHGTLKGSYDYLNFDNTPEGTSIYKWYRSDDTTGLNETQIEGASSSQYALTDEDCSKYIRFAVSPVEQNNDVPGIEVKSKSFAGPILDWLCGLPKTDPRDGQVYPTAKIGNQCWMSRNLNYGSMIDSCTDQTTNGTFEKYCYHDDPANCEIYGGLYTWLELSSDGNLNGYGGCPDGWRLPGRNEVFTLENFLGGSDIAGNMMKEQGSAHWNAPNTGAANLSGFSALAAGCNIPWEVCRYNSGLGNEAVFLTCCEDPSLNDFGGLCFNANERSVMKYTLYDNISYVLNECTTFEDLKAYSLRCLQNTCNENFLPTTANAGPDQINIPDISTTLQANAPQLGNGYWSIESGEGGNVEETSNPTSIFTGIAGNSYTLKWIIVFSCHSFSDYVTISFLYCDPMPSQADAGPDQIDIIGSSTTLAGNTPTSGTGRWRIISGTGGSIADTLNPTSSFTGLHGNFYTLRWIITTTCGSRHDDVVISFCTLPTTADAGPDQLNLVDTTTYLGGNFPANGDLGLWTIISGEGGNIEDPTSANSIFTGLSGNSYTLRWTIWNYCGSNYDDEAISFCSVPTTANAGPDQLNLSGTSVTLAGNTPTSGTGLWSIVSGNGGNIIQPSNPTSQFIGISGNSYTLRWTISNNCGASSDDVVISFVNFSCGSTLTDNRDGKTYGTVQIGAQCWMKSNLNIGTMINGNTDQTNNGTIEKYCYDDNPDDCAIYGGLYQWNEMMQYTTVPGTQGICPTGWHLPTHNDWTTMVTYLGGVSAAGGHLKETGTVHWFSPNQGADNSSGFTGLPGGYRDDGGGYGNQLYFGQFWLSTESVTNEAWDGFLEYSTTNAFDFSNEKIFGFSVRCLKN
jgi:uncharacterized protein (TIGR02145 family)